MKELRAWLYQLLTQIHNRVFHEQAPQTEPKPYPYVVFNFPSSDVTNYRENYILEVDVWDRPEDGDSAPMQDIADAIDRRLNRTHHTDPAGWFARIYRTEQMAPPDPDPKIRRRLLRYEIRTYDGRS